MLRGQNADRRPALVVLLHPLESALVRVNVVNPRLDGFTLFVDAVDLLGAHFGRHLGCIVLAPDKHLADEIALMDDRNQAGQEADLPCPLLAETISG